jgi:hypothetical protein
MAITLSQFLNRTVLVCIPLLHDDKRPRPYTLVGIEVSGVWLESEDLTKSLRPSGKREPPPMIKAAFIPFTQIAHILDGTYIPTPAQKAAAIAVEKELALQRGEKYEPEKAPAAPVPEKRTGPKTRKKQSSSST